MSGPSAPAVLRARGVTACAPGSRLPVLHGIDLDLAPGECLGVIGRSGSGKSTLVRVLLGLQPGEGDIRWFGDALPRSAGAGARALRRRVQYVPQDPLASLDPRWRVRRSLEEPLRALRVGADDVERGRLVDRALERVGLEPHLAERRPRELSGGQVQRAVVARALAVGAEVLVADEPLSAVDRPRRARLMALWEDLRRDDGLALLLISHDLPATARLCDRLAVLDDGRVVEHGAVVDVLGAPAHPATRCLLAGVPRLDRAALPPSRP